MALASMVTVFSDVPMATPVFSGCRGSAKPLHSVQEADPEKWHVTGTWIWEATDAL